MKKIKQAFAPNLSGNDWTLYYNFDDNKTKLVQMLVVLANNCLIERCPNEGFRLRKRIFKSAGLCVYYISMQCILYIYYTV